MKKEFKDNQKTAYTIIYLLMVFSLANVLSSVLVVDLNIVGKFVITVLIGLIVQLFVLIPTTLIPVLVISIATILLFNRYNQEAVIRVLLWIQQFYQNISNHFNGTEEILLKNSRALWIIIITLISLYTMIILFKIKRNFLLLPVYLLFFVYYWYIYIDISYTMMALFLMLYIILLGCNGYFKAQRSWDKEKANYSTRIYPHWFKTAMSYGLIIILLAGVIPKGGAVIDWQWLESKIEKRFPSLLDFRDDVVYSRSYGQAEMFDFASTGFQPNSNQLGGPVKINERVVMKVKAPYPLYLRGNIKNIYDDNHWENDTSEERTYNIKSSLPLEVVFGSTVTVEIIHENLASKTVFSPYQPIILSESDIDRIKVDKNYQITLLGSKYKGERYEVKARIPSRLVSFDDEEGITDYFEYLQLPISLSETVYELGDSITTGAKTPYEKAILIRDYLRENYKYSLEPSFTPNGDDFVEYFLFEEKEGYCTYFATAMAILLRTQGVPSRYVEGYMMPTENEEGIYEVRQSNAHAWVEAYMGNGNWITFEATPAFEIPTFQDFDVSTESFVYSPRTSWNNRDEIYLDTREDTLWGDESLDIDMDASIRKPATPIFSSSLSEVWDYLSKSLWILFVIFILGFVPMRVFYIHVRIKKYHKSLWQIKGSNMVLYLYQNISQLLDELGYGILQGETAYEYARRITNKMYNYEHDFRTLTDSYIKAKYSHIEMSYEDKELIFDFFQFIEWKVRSRKGFFKYFYIKYLKGRLYHCYNVSDETIAYL